MRTTRDCYIEFGLGSIRIATGLLVYDENRNGSPFERFDPVTLCEDAQMREVWAKLHFET